MIDLERLELAYNLANEHYENTGESVIIEYTQSFGCHHYNPKLWINCDKYENFSLEEIIDKIKVIKHEREHKTYPKPTIGLFGNEIQNQEMKRIMDGVYDRLQRLEAHLTYYLQRRGNDE